MATITNLLVATDLTDRSEYALARALEIQQGIGDGLLTVLHVLPSGLPGRIERNQRADAESYLAERLSEIPSAHGSSVEAVVRIGDAFSVIINESVARRAELLVLGEPGRHQRTHQFAGTTAECVMRFSSCPVLLVRRKAKGRYGRVVVAFDGSDGAVRALRTALTIAPGAEYRIVHAWWPQRQMLEGRARAVDAERNRMRGLIQREVKRAFSSEKSACIDLEIELIEDNPYQAISNALSGADLLVMGTHSRGRLASTVTIGSLALHMLTESKCDMLLARP